MVVAIATLALGAARATAGALGADGDPLAAYRLERGAFELGFGVAPLKLRNLDDLAPAATPAPVLPLVPVDPDPRTYDPRSAAISFDLKLRWPGDDAAGNGGGLRLGGLRPYVTLGPALLVAQPTYSLLAGRDPTDYAMSLGLKGGAGVTWQVDRNVSLFGEYGFTRSADDNVLPRNRTGESLDTQGFRYGVKIRF